MVKLYNLYILAILAGLSACTATAVDSGCMTYGNARLSMPPLGADPLSEWVAVADSAMTGACR